jgi:hypothetical protein
VEITYRKLYKLVRIPYRNGRKKEKRREKKTHPPENTMTFVVITSSESKPPLSKPPDKAQKPNHRKGFRQASSPPR